MDDMIDRLFMFLEHKKLSQNKFETECGLAHTNLREKKQGPTSEYLAKIITRYPELNLNWLISGRGPMILSEDTTRQASAPRNDIHHNNNVNVEAMREEFVFLHEQIRILQKEKMELWEMLKQKVQCNES